MNVEVTFSTSVPSTVSASLSRVLDSKLSFLAQGWGFWTHTQVQACSVFRTQTYLNQTVGYIEWFERGLLRMSSFWVSCAHMLSTFSGSSFHTIVSSCFNFLTPERTLSKYPHYMWSLYPSSYSGFLLYPTLWLPVAFCQTPVINTFCSKDHGIYTLKKNKLKNLPGWLSKNHCPNILWDSLDRVALPFWAYEFIFLSHSHFFYFTKKVCSFYSDTYGFILDYG